MADAVRQGTQRRFAELIERLHDVRFVNLINDGGNTHSLNSILCLFTNRQARESPMLLALRDDINVTVHDYCPCFLNSWQLWTRLALCCIQSRWTICLPL
jgi:hypothetical protein